MKAPLIGIGVTTYNRPDVIKKWRQQISNYLPENYVLDIQDDSLDRKGVAYRKTCNLRALQHCDYIFLFDDDCYPISSNWYDYFITLHKYTGEHHYLFLNAKNHKIESIRYLDTIHSSCGGVFMFLTNEAVQKVGAFGEYSLYGSEHAGYSHRVHNVGLTTKPYMCGKLTNEHLFAEDYSTVNFKSSINDFDKIAQGKLSLIHFEKDKQLTYLPL
jgi:hypothetical protein